MARLRQQTSTKGLVENFRVELAGGRSIELQDAWKAFLGKPKRKAIGDAQLRANKTRWDDFLAFMAAEYPAVKNLAQIEPGMAEAYIMYIRAKGKFSKSVDYKRDGGRKAISYKAKADQQFSARNCNAYHSTLQQVVQLLAYDAGVTDNPFKLIPKMQDEPESREAFTAPELTLIGEKADDFVRPIFAIGINTGLREGDICTLRKDEVDLATDWITRRMMKTGKNVRIPILRGLRGYLAELAAASCDDDSEYLLPAQAAMYLGNRSGISYRVRTFLEDIGIETTRKVEGRTRRVSVKDVHSCRHTFCYLAAVNNMPFPVVKSIVGHVSPNITAIYMDHASDEMKQAKIEYLGDPLGLGPALATAAEVDRDGYVIELLQSATAKNWQEKITKAVETLKMGELT